MAGWGRAHPARATGLLAAGLAAVGAGLGAAADPQSVLPAPGGLPPLVVGVALAVLFGLAELCLLHVEVRRQAYSVTLAGFPLVLGVLLAGPRELIAARVVGSAVAFTLQRSPLRKAGYNLAAYAAEAAVDVTAAQLLLGRERSLDADAAVLCYLVVVVVDQVMSLLVGQVITWHQGRLTRRQTAAVHLPALLSTVLATTAAFVVVALADDGVFGVIVLTVTAVAAAAAYRSYQILHRRHDALAHVHAFVGLTTGGGGADALAGRMLAQVRSLMRAATAELLLVDAGTTIALSVGEDDLLRVDPAGWAAADRVVDHVRAHDAPLLLPAGTRRSTDRAWLRTRGVTDAVIVALPRGSGDGALMVFDRLGDTGSFTREDQSLLQTLAGHLAVAVTGSRLLDRLRYEATHDVLTGLANRALLEDTVHASLTVPGVPSAMLLLDLDRFKEVNDTLGHHIGDALLRAVAATLTATLPAEATVARLGGDEFAVFLPAADLDAAHHLAVGLSAALAVPVQLPETTLTARASIGVATATTGAGDAGDADLLRHADTAMYAAKRSGSSVAVYTADLDHGRAERLVLLADLATALDRGELELRYQPKLDLATDQITSVEALVRWRHPRLGLLSPDVFIPLAETNGMIGALTAQVLTQALTQCAAWRRNGIDLAVAVNLSARTVNDPALPEQVTAALLAAGVPATRLILEITESAVMDDPTRAVVILERIAAIGVILSLDDFGTGYSSLAYLQRLPVSEVKIDRSFITGLRADSPDTQVLVRAIINLATNLGHRVVAEGAEDQATVDLLRDLGCHLVQGYHISPPDHPDQIITLVHAHPGNLAALLTLAR